MFAVGGKSKRQVGSRKHRFKKEQRAKQQRNKLLDAERNAKRAARALKPKKISNKTKKTNMNVEFVVAAIKLLNERKGSSLGAIENKLIKGGFMVDNKIMIRRAVQKGVGIKRLLRDGARFRVNPDSKPPAELSADAVEEAAETLKSSSARSGIIKRRSLIYTGERFNVGTRCECLWNGEDEYYPGHVSAVRDNGTYDISYDDGDEESGVEPHLVRLLLRNDEEKKQVVEAASSSLSDGCGNGKEKEKENPSSTSTNENNGENTSPSSKETKQNAKGLKIKDIIVGKGREALSGSKITVEYKGKLAKTGRLFDSNKSFTFTLDDGNVIRGWDLGLLGMKVGGKRRLTIPSPLGYGSRGSPGGTVPPNSKLIFLVRLISVHDPLR
eukprot:g6.t1